MMFTFPTVLILGAGGSQPYGFPLAVQLKESIISSVINSRHNHSLPLAQWLRRNFHNDPDAFNEHKINTFVNDLRLSGTYSIDSFLADRPEFLSLGKAAIASCLIPMERPDNVQGNWYQYLVNQIWDMPKGLPGKLSILTFNYERSIEYYLRTAFQRRYGCSQDEAEALVSQIEIIYLNGNLGDLPSKQTNGGRRFSPDIHSEIIEGAVQSLRIVHEKFDVDRFRRAHAILEGARNVCFLGFSFHQLNVERLLPPGGFKNAEGRIFGTAYKMGAAEMERAKRRFPVRLELSDLDCEKFLRDVLVLY